MKHARLLKTTVATLCLSMASFASADTFELNFTASGFASVINNTSAPQDLVSGRITFEADALGAPVISISSVDLVIDGHVYQASDIGGEVFGPGYFFGAHVSDDHGISWGTDDFYMTTVPGIANFTYSSSNAFDGWSTAQLSAAVTQVPEPSAAAMTLAGLAGLAGFARRRRTLSVVTNKA